MAGCNHCITCNCLLRRLKTAMCVPSTTMPTTIPSPSPTRWVRCSASNSIPTAPWRSGAIGFDITQSPARASQFTYDAYGDLASKTDALGPHNHLRLRLARPQDLDDQPIPAGSTAAAATTTYQYDALSHLTQTSAPLGRVTSSQYDANGNKISDTDARGNTTQYKYDALNRLVETDYPDGTKVRQDLDFRNHVVTETDRGGHVSSPVRSRRPWRSLSLRPTAPPTPTTTSYAYDNAGRLAGETDPLGHTTNYTSDAAGNLIAVSGLSRGQFSPSLTTTRGTRLR